MVFKLRRVGYSVDLKTTIVTLIIMIMLILTRIANMYCLPSVC